MTNKKFQDVIANSAKETGFTYKAMPSHDTQERARKVPFAIIFVPSKDGISHSPAEYTSPQDMANGATILLKTILTLDKGR